MQQLGKYEILEPLGGGLGSVYRARDTVLDREVALKTIITGSDVSAEVRERFYREGRACARLQHPHIVTVYDLGEQNGVAYIVMELLTGADLQRIITEKRPLALATRLELAAQVAEALGYAHHQGIIHRDIKPANIFIQDQGAKILDFGVARIASSQLTRLGSALGTPDYMAPEQISGQVCESLSDLFSAAILFFEFFSYTHPFQGRNIPRRIMYEPPAALRSVSPGLPLSLEGVLARGLEKDPGRRFQSGEEFAAALRVVAQEVTSVEPPKAPAPPPEPRPRASALTDPIFDALRLRAQQLLEKDPESCLVFIRSLGPKQQADGELQRLRREAEARRAAGAAAEPVTNRGPVPAAVETLPPPPRPVAVMAAPALAAAAPPLAALAPAPAPAAAAPPPAAPPPVPVSMLVGGETPPSNGPLPLPLPLPRLQPLARPAELPLPPPLPQTSQVRLLPNQKQILAACVVVLLLAAGVILWQLRSRSGRPVAAAVATAEVTGEAAAILREPRPEARPVTAVKKGDTVSLLQLPASRDEQWVWVQLASNRRVPSGYLRVADLGQWSSEEPETALQLLKLFAPPDAASETELLAYLDRLGIFSSRFGITPQGPAANLERARVHLVLAGRLQQAERPVSDWQPHLDDATGQLAMASAEASLAPQVGPAREELERLKAWEPPAPRVVKSVRPRRTRR